MELNLKYYKDNTKYDNSKIEKLILNYIKSGKTYDEIIKEDSRWPVLYNLSNIRKNLINWYPFDKNKTILEIGAGMGAITESLCEKCSYVTSIELSKTRADAIFERNKNRNNLEIIVGYFNEIKFDKKFDYILLTGVLECSSMYCNDSNDPIAFLSKIKNLLNIDGKILIATDNRFGMKYWCGATDESNSNPIFSMSEHKNDKIRLFSKSEIIDLAEEINMKYNFYYLLPDYKFPEILLTDEYLSKNNFCNYTPYYYKKMNLLINENDLYKDIISNNQISFFSNSYFVELTEKNENKKIQFAKFCNYRKDKYKLTTIFDGKNYVKIASKESKDFLHIVAKNNEDISKINNISDSVLKDDRMIIEEINGENLRNILIKEHDFKKFIELFDNYVNYVKENSNYIIPTENIFQKNNINIDDKKLHFLSIAYIDLIPSNIIKKGNSFVMIDQEWTLCDCPIEFIIFRGIKSVCDFLNVKFGKKMSKQLWEKYEIYPYIKPFEELDSIFINEVCSLENSAFKKYANNLNILDNYMIERKKIMKCNNLLLIENNRKDIIVDKMSKENRNIMKDFDILLAENNRKDQVIEEISKKYNELELELKSLVNEMEILKKNKGWKIFRGRS